MQRLAGVRVPEPPEPRRALWCPDPGFHPAEPLAAVTARILRAPPGALPHCPVCPAGRGTVTWHGGTLVHRLCAGCGVGLAVREGPHDPRIAAARAEQWRLVRRRRA
ncbi:hypothetical protein PV721_08970 [Streptomyces sp. MB09-01]|uniref:hypothetical protein n=1 Tax=Streptomyces sp. MB09-01 TaxID=3028666 RepID=UPI0029A2FE4B|nr:hypothetical protein [Streptomyces sp. MB09-01]MDX3534498.1 hypothetical protein [Streptomyces sp. MB09-01]